MQKVKAMHLMNKIVAIIREKHEVSFGVLCYEAEIAPSTLYSYIPMICDLFSDIKYVDRKFIVE